MAKRKAEQRHADLLARIAKAGDSGICVSRLVEDAHGDPRYPTVPSLRRVAIDNSMRVLAKRGAVEVVREESPWGSARGWSRRYWRAARHE